MIVLGIESSCDECAAAVVENGEKILSNVVATQIPFHAVYNGVVPEIAGRKHAEWIQRVVREALEKAETAPSGIDAVAATARPGLLGSLLVGLSFAKAFAWARNLPFAAVDHIKAHLYASRLEAAEGAKPDYPFLGLLVSGGHTIICRANDFDDLEILGTTVDDAAGEAFDKVAKHYGFGYPGGIHIEKLAQTGNDSAFRFPLPNLRRGSICDVSYSGLKNAVVNQLETFRTFPRPQDESQEKANIAASFQKTAVDILARALFRAVEETGIRTIAAGGGVAANSLLRARLAERQDLHCIFPPLELCGDNGAMIAGIAYPYLKQGKSDPLNTTASARVSGFKRRYF